MEQDKTGDGRSAKSEADIVESGGETTAAATGAAEIGAATINTASANSDNARPVGAGTMVKVADRPDESAS